MRIALGHAHNDRFVSVLALLFLAGCTTEQHSGLIPSGDLRQGHARVVSSIVEAGGTSYVVDQMYTPAEANLGGITTGPQDRIWFTSDVGIARSSITGDMIYLRTPYYATSIVEGPDQNLWLTIVDGEIGRLSTEGHLTAFPIDPKVGGARADPFAITKGPSNTLWFLSDSSTDYVVRMTLAGEMKGYRMVQGSRPQWLTAASDGAIWFTDSGTNKIGRISAAGTLKEFAVPTPNAGVLGVCQGPDGNVWFVEEGANKIGSVTPAGSFKEYEIPTRYSGAFDIVAGPDKALWFTEESAGQIGRITTSGGVVELKLSGTAAEPEDITVGPDKNIWFTESQSYGILGRVDLHEVKDSDPVYATITLSIGKRRPELGISEKFPLSITVDSIKHHIMEGKYPNPIHLTTNDPKQAGLSAKIVTSSVAKVNVSYSGHYAQAVISANAAGGGRINTAAIDPTLQPEKKLPSPGYGITYGPNDLLWMCLANGKIASYSATGVLHVYRATTSFTEEGCSMVAGPDGNIWFTDYSNNRIGTITPSGHVTFFQLTDEASPSSMALGSDGAFFFTENLVQKIARLTTSGQLKTWSARGTPLDIVAGSDGNLWYNTGNGDIYKMTTSGRITRVRNVYEMDGLWAADNNIWFYSAQNMELEEMSTAGGIVAKYRVPENCLPFGLASGPENSIWYVDAGNYCVARMTLSGKVVVVPTYTQKNNPQLITQIVNGPNGYLWFTETGNAGLGWIDPATM